MEVHRAFGLARRATGECNQADIITAGGVRLKRRLMLGHAGFNAIGCFSWVRPEPQHLLQGRCMVCMRSICAMMKFFCQQTVTQCSAHLRLVHNLLQFCSAQQGHGGHNHQACLERSQETSGHHGAVAPAQQQTLTRL